MSTKVTGYQQQIDKNQLVEKHAPLVKRIAHHLLARLPASVLVDDLIQSGKTTSETSIAMKGLWAKSVNSIAIHWVCPNDSHIDLAKNVDKLIVTDSIPVNVKRAKTVDNMEVISIKELVKKIILEN